LFDFNEIWYVGRGRWRYAVWPDPRSRSRDLESRKFGHFQPLAPAPTTMWLANDHRLLH